jgi:hypothetical protein
MTAKLIETQIEVRSERCSTAEASPADILSILCRFCISSGMVTQAH